MIADTLDRRISSEHGMFNCASVLDAYPGRKSPWMACCVCTVCIEYGFWDLVNGIALVICAS